MTFTEFKSGETVRIYNNAGQLAQSYKIGADGSLTVSLSNFQPGIYIVKTQYKTFKFIKKMKKVFHIYSPHLCISFMCRCSICTRCLHLQKWEKNKYLRSEEVDSLVFFDTDNSTTPSVTEENFELPAADFTKTLTELKATEVAKGFTATQPNSGKLILEKTVNGKTVHWEYNGNGQGVYYVCKKHTRNQQNRCV